MLGYFIETHKSVQGKEEAYPGMPLVSVAAADTLMNTGLAEGLSFGVVGRDGDVIACIPQPGTPEEPHYEVKRLTWEEFAADRTLFSYELPIPAPAEKVAARAEAAVGSQFHELRSFPGDDFVMECFTGYDMVRFMKDNPHIGTHMQTPLLLSPAMLLRVFFKNDLGLEESAWLNPTLYEVTHHGMRIENQFVIHFSTCRVPDETNQVKWDTLETFRHISSTQGIFSAVPHEHGDAAHRLKARHVAVYHMLHRQDYGDYDPLFNNCEDLCYLCTEGEKQSPQVRDGFIGFLKMLLKTLPTMLIPGRVEVKAVLTVLNVISQYLQQRHISE